MLRTFEDSLDVVVQQALDDWQPASVGAVRDGRIRVVMESGGSTRVVRDAPAAQQVRPPPLRAWMVASERHVRGAAARPIGMSPTSSNSSLLSICYDGGARDPGEGNLSRPARLEQRHRVDRDGRDDRDDGVDDEALRCVGVVCGPAFLRAAGFSVVRREAGEILMRGTHMEYVRRCTKRGPRWSLSVSRRNCGPPPKTCASAPAPYR